MMGENKTGMEITLQDLFSILIKRLWLIILCMIVCAGVGYAYSKYYVIPLYRSEVMFLVDPIYNSNYDDYTDAQRLSLEYQSSLNAKQLFNTYVQILQTSRFKNNLLKQYDQKYNKPFNGSVTVVEIADTQLFKIRVTSTSIEDAYDIANLIETVAPGTIEEVMGAEKIRVTDEAVKSTSSINNNITRTTMLGAVLGAVAAYCIGFLIFLLDVRIKNEEDLKKRYNVPVLGSIVDFNTTYKINKK